MRLYQIHGSGNCYRVRLMLSLLGRTAETVEVDHAKGDLTSDWLRALNPLAEVPVLIDGDIRLRDSQAILVHLARRYGAPHWLPLDAEPLARVQQWLSFAANEIQNGPRYARAIVLFGVPADLAEAQARARRALDFMNRHLHGRDWLETDAPTVADVACYPYTAWVADGGLAMADYPSVAAWLRRVEALPGFIPLEHGAPATGGHHGGKGG